MSEDKPDFDDLLRDKSILLTGGTGFIGKNLLDFIIDKNINLNRLTLVTRNINKFKDDYKNLSKLSNIDFIETDICNLEYNSGKYDYIIHAATNVVESTHQIKLSNDIVTGTHRVLDFTIRSGASGLINFSSGAVYGNFEKLAKIPEIQHPEFDLANLKSTYGISKYYAEHLVSLYAHNYQFNAINLRCFAFVGKYLNPHHYAIGDFITKAIKNQDIVVTAGKHIYRSYLAVEELIESMFKLLNDSLNHNIIYESYNIGSDEAISIPDLAYRVRDVLNSESRISCPNYDDENIYYYVPNIDKLIALGVKIKTKLSQLISHMAL